MLNGSWWNTVITLARITFSGVANSLVRAVRLIRTRHAHQITAAALYILLWRAYSKFLESDQSIILDFYERKDDRWEAIFCIVATVLDFQLCVFQLVYSIRTEDFRMYVQCLTKLMAWMFALDHFKLCSLVDCSHPRLAILEEIHPGYIPSFLLWGVRWKKNKTHFFSSVWAH